MYTILPSVQIKSESTLGDLGVETSNLTDTRSDILAYSVTWAEEMRKMEQALLDLKNEIDLLSEDTDKLDFDYENNYEHSKKIWEAEFKSEDVEQMRRYFQSKLQEVGCKVKIRIRYDIEGRQFFK